MNEKPQCRGLCFSLRTMFVVVTFVSIWLGWQLKIVRDRREMLVKLASGTGWFITTEQYPHTPTRPGADLRAYRVPFWRAWFGDAPIAEIGFETRVSQAERERVKKLFGEAYLADQ